MSVVDLEAKIPNNVNLRDNKRLSRALEKWLPGYLEWWSEMGPSDFHQHDIYLRTAVGVGKGGWAHFDYVKMPEYRWGIFLADPVEDRKIHFGDNIGDPVWDEVPGEMRNRLRRLIVTQGDTEPASVEQQRMLGHTAPSLYDMRNLFQVNVEEGRHLWAMVYLLHQHFGADGRDEADSLLERRSGNPDHPRILQAFNNPIETWLDFFAFTAFTDRDGKYQLAALAESGFDPLARTTQFMLTEEAFHMQTGENGIGRVVHRTADLMREGVDPRSVGAIPLDMIQRYVNYWASASMDLFGGEDSTNAAESFASGLKGRYLEADRYKEHSALEHTYKTEVPEDGALVEKEIPLRRAMNALLLDDYVADCKRIVARWDRDLKRAELDAGIALPSSRFNRRQGIYAGHCFDPQGNLVSEEEFARRADGEWLPSQADRDYVKSCMVAVHEPGKIANWIAPPARGVNDQPFDFEYVKFH